MLVRDLMQREVATLDADDHLDLADDVMRLGRIRHLPILSGGRLVGILSQRDLFRAAVSSLLQLDRPAQQEWLGKVPVRAVMATDVVTIAASRPAEDAVALLLERKIGCLPVMDGERLVGLVSESDCLRFLAHLLDISATKARLPELP